MKRSFLSLMALLMLSLGVNAQQDTTPEKEINTDQDGMSATDTSVTTDEVAENLQEFGEKAVETGRKIGVAILDSMKEISLTQTLDAQNNKAELSYVAGVKGTAVTLDVTENIKVELKWYDEQIPVLEDGIQENIERIAYYNDQISELQDEIASISMRSGARFEASMQRKSEMIRHYNNMIAVHQNGLDWRTETVEKYRTQQKMLQEVKITPKFGLYGLEVAFNVISNENVLAIQEAYVHALGVELEGKFGNVSLYGIGLRSSRFEGEKRDPVQVMEFVLAGIEYELHIRLTEDGKVKLLVAAGFETGVAIEPTGDGLYGNIYGDIGLQVGNLVIEALVEARGTMLTRLDHKSEYLQNSGYFQPGLKLTYHFTEDFAVQGGVRYNTSTERTTVDLGVKVTPDFFKDLFKKRD